jgi:hypothetical protein
LYTYDIQLVPIVAPPRSAHTATSDGEKKCNIKKTKSKEKKKNPTEAE